MLGLRYDTEPARALAARIAEVLRDEAYRASAALAGEKGASRCSMPMPTGWRLRGAPARTAARRHPGRRPAQFAPAVDRADRHYHAGFCRQRVQRHRAGLLPRPTSGASACRMAATSRSRWPTMPGGFTGTWVATWRACRTASSRRCRCRRWTTCACCRPCSPISTPASARRSTCRRTILTMPSATSTGSLEGRPLGLATYRPNRVLGAVLWSRRRPRPPPALAGGDDLLRRPFSSRPVGDTEVTSKIGT